MHCLDQLAYDSPADLYFVPSHQYSLLGVFLVSVSLKLPEDKTAKSTMRTVVIVGILSQSKAKQKARFLQMEPTAYLEMLNVISLLVVASRTTQQSSTVTPKCLFGTCRLVGFFPSPLRICILFIAAKLIVLFLWFQSKKPG